MLDESKWQETFDMHMSKHIYLNMCEDLGNQNVFKTNMDILCESLDLIIQRQGGAIPRSKTGTLKILLLSDQCDIDNDERLQRNHSEYLHFLIYFTPNVSK